MNKDITSSFYRNCLAGYAGRLNVQLCQLEVDNSSEFVKLKQIYKLCTAVYVLYCINQAEELSWENMGLRSWQYGLSTVRSVQKRIRGG